MKKRLLYSGLVIVVTQLFGSGCFCLVERWRSNHPCGTYNHHPLLHPIQTRRAIFQSEGNYQAGSAGSAGAVVSPPCHGCGTPGVPVTYDGVPTGFVPTGNPPTIGYPTPLIPGPKVVPYYELPTPMQVPK
jgi:hypothetical protein